MDAKSLESEEAIICARAELGLRSLILSIFKPTTVSDIAHAKISFIGDSPGGEKLKRVTITYDATIFVP